MRSNKPRRWPSLQRSLAWFLPALLIVLATAWIPRAWAGYTSLPLLLAATLAMAASSRALGFEGEAGFWRTLWQRGPAHFISLAIYTALVALLLAWPLDTLANARSLVATLALAAALVAALALLWRLWPVFALVFEWDDAYSAGAPLPRTPTALARSLRFALHLTAGRDLFISHFLPAALAQLSIAFATLTLADLGAHLPEATRYAALAIYGLGLLPLCSWLVAHRSLRLLWDEPRRVASSLNDLEAWSVDTAANAPASPQDSDVPPPAQPDGAVDAAADPLAGALPVPAAATDANLPVQQTDAIAAPAPAIAAAVHPLSTQSNTPAPALVQLMPEAAVAANEAAATSLSQATLDEGLLSAARAGQVATALEWLQRGANPDAAPGPGARDQRSALVLAAELTDSRMARTLIAHRAHVNRAQAGLTPLLASTRSCHSGRPETVTTLIANGADPALADADGNTPLHHAALCGEPAVAAILLDAQAPLEARNRNQQTPLATAAEAANWPLLRFLLERGAHADAALPAAAGITDDDPFGVQVLLKAKARVDAVDALGRSALLHAACEGHLRIARVLLEAGADASLADRYGTTPLMEAARAGAAALIPLLAEYQAEVHASDRHGRSALTLACQSPRAGLDCARALLVLGADPQAKGGDGRSAIDQAGAAGRWDLVAVLEADAGPATRPRPPAGQDTPAHLLQALRAERWSLVAGFTDCLPGWPADMLAGLYLELANHAGDAPRAWLLDHGLAAEARLASGERLFDAVLDQLPGAHAALQQLLAAGATPAGAGGFARLLAHSAGAPDCMPLALVVLASGADPFGADPDGRTPLHHASTPVCLPVLRALLELGADPNARDRAGATPLHLALAAAPTAALPLVQRLILHGADPEAPTASGETPLGLALARGAQPLEVWLRWSDWSLPKRRLRDADLPAAVADPEAISRLLELGLAVDGRDDRGATALLRASGAGAVASMQRLLAAHADPTLAVASGATPLSAAVTGRNIHAVRTLIAAGVAIDHRHADAVTALMIAAALGFPDMVVALRVLGARVELLDARGRDALHAAARFGFASRDSLRCRRLLDALLKDNPAPDVADATGATPLLALLGVHSPPGTDGNGTHLGALLPVLLDTGASLGHANQHGVTPLHACAMHALLEPARVLLSRGADRNARDFLRRTPADVARALGYVDLALELSPRRGPLPA